MRFGVVPNTAIIDATVQINPYIFFQGQTITLFVDRNQPTVLADELVRITVFNPTTSTTVQITSSRGYNISGIGATASYSTGSCLNGMTSCGTAASIANTVSYTIPSGWGLGPGLTFSISPGTQCTAAPCSGATPACTGAGCPGGGGGSTGLSSSGVLTATANATITVLASSLGAVDVFDPYTGNSVLAMGESATIASMSLSVSVSFTAIGGVVNVAPTTKLYFSNTGGGCGGACTNIPGSTLSFRTYGTYTYPTLTVYGANTGVHALKILIPANIMTTSTGSFGGVTPGTSATWVVSVTAGGVTNYSGFFSLFQPLSATPTMSVSPSVGSSPSTTPTPTPTPSLSRGAQPSVSATNSFSSQTPSPFDSTTPTPTPSVTPTASALPCSAGYFPSIFGCAPCSPGTFAPANAAVCSLCPQGTYGSRAGLTSAACSGPCASCPAGSSAPPAATGGSGGGSSSPLTCVTADARALPPSLSLQLWPAAHPENAQRVDLVIAPLGQCQQMTSTATCAAAASLAGEDGTLRYVVGTAAAFHMEADATLTCAWGGGGGRRGHVGAAGDASAGMYVHMWLQSPFSFLHAARSRESQRSLHNASLVAHLRGHAHALAAHNVRHEGVGGEAARLPHERARGDVARLRRRRVVLAAGRVLHGVAQAVDC